jgi:hypothetical protein
MYPLFVLLFKTAYWRTLCSADTWRHAWISFRRVHKDKRARKHLRSFAALLLIPCLCLVYAVWLLRTGAVFLLAFAVPLVWWMNRSRKKDEVLMHITPQPPPLYREPTDAERRSLRAYFGQLALFYAVMTERAASEGFLKEKMLPENVEVIVRRKHIDLLRSTALWDRLAPRDREAIMAPDGHWEWRLINQVSEQLEAVRLLRWMIRIDHFLPVVGRQLHADYRLAHDIVQSPQRVLEGKELISIRNVETAKAAAAEFFARCLAEALSRGYYSTEDERMQTWAKDVSESLKGRHHEDLLLGNKLVSETDEAALRWATELSRKRLGFLTRALEILNGADLPLGTLTVFPEEQPQPA